MFLFAEIYRGRTRIQSVRLFENLADAFEHYKHRRFNGHLWEIQTDVAAPMVPLSDKELEERIKGEYNVSLQQH